ncbi:MAG: L-threonylcarbamoyladenylate synthase [Bacillota bacterium]|nr:L-threonylcarbamoyladenylate synthase [Bacillota bacterium]
MKTEIFKENFAEAAEIIRAGGLVAVPTETVYGLAGNGLDAAAVEKIYEVKGRPAVKPLALMVPDASAMELYCEDVPEQAKFLAEKFWPGPLSIVLKSKELVPGIVRAGGSTVALRCPDHAMTLGLLKAAKLPFAAPSANPSGEPSPKNAETVKAYFDGKIEGIIDGGECGIGMESTIIDMSAAPYKILRRAALSEEKIRSALAENLKVIGITGGTGCGKTTALLELEKRGALIIDCDAVYHELLESSGEMLSDIENAFPAAFEDGKLVRKKLGGIVFNDNEKLMQLNELTHRHIIREVESRLECWAMQGGKAAAIDAIALIESGIAEHCSAVIGVVADRGARIERIAARDNISREYAERRVDAQKNEEFYLKNCDYIARNDGTEQEFIAALENILNEVL